jgi:hypothetical protein
VVIELNEAISVLDDDVPDPSVAFEEPLDVSLPDVVGDVADVNSLARRHDRSNSGKKTLKNIVLVNDRCKQTTNVSNFQ